MACEAPLNLAINVLQTQSCCRIRGSYEQEPIPAHAKVDLNNYLPLWCTSPTASYRLVAVGTNNVYPLGSDSFVTVGRNVSAKVVLSSLSVSRMHAALMHDSLNQTFLVDLGSSHGTFMGTERLTPYVPTLVTKKSLIRFGTCDIQYLLLTLCAEESIFRDACQFECPNERDVFLNTQYNVRNSCPPTGAGEIDEEATFFSRLNTFNFVNILKQPELTRSVGSSGSVDTCSEEHNIGNIETNISIISPEIAFRSPANFQKMSIQVQSSSLQSLGSYQDNESHNIDCTVFKMSTEQFKSNNTIQIGNIDLPTGTFGSSDLSDVSCFRKTDNNFINSCSNNICNESSIKRCATVAGVDEDDLEEESASFAFSPGESDRSCLPCPPEQLPLYSPRQHRRRRMSEEPLDFNFASDRSENRAMSLSLEVVECASIGGSSTGFISSGSMSECEEDNDEKKRKKVSFWDIPIEIPPPIFLNSFDFNIFN